jgi:ubiquitin carboxyl-terminal hydrolase 4/11/15
VTRTHNRMEMDPQSVAFMPRDELWRINSEMSRLQQTQHEHAERLSRVERRQDEDISRTKSLWGSQSPFPGILAGTPQQRPVEQPPVDAFSGFDDPSNLIGSLHLDADDEPRRVGATSRANSVRFDESANQGHWAHPSRASLELLPRSGSSLGSHPMIERTYSHKSDGRQSSAGQSVHSAASRANSLGIDTLNAMGGEGPPINPGLFLLGTCPAIIRCWLTTKFKHDSLLYAAVCTGSNHSSLSIDLVAKLGFAEQIRLDDTGAKKIKINLYLPEATVRTASARSNILSSQLPSITVDFTVVTYDNDENDRAIKVILGSDVLRIHNADILFSSNTLIIYDDEQAKLSVPLVRPENECIFKSLQTSGSSLATADKSASLARNGNSKPESIQKDEIQSQEEPKDDFASPSPSIAPSAGTREEPRLSSDSSNRPPFAVLSTTREPETPVDTASPSSKSGPSQPIWNSWRRDPDKSTATSDSNWGKTSSNYQRRETGIKVLRPLKSSARSVSTTQPAASPSGSQSRFFEDGKRRTSGDGFDGGSVKRVGSGPTSTAGSAKEGSTTGRPASSNPVGVGTAFSWLSK